MPKNINSASRLVSLLRSIPAHPDNTQSLEVWARLFEIAEENPNRKSIAVTDRLSVMYRELEIVRDEMKKANFSEDLYLATFTSLEHAFSAMLLPASWNSVRQYLTPDTFTTLAFCGEILPNEESQIDPTEIADIKILLEDLENSLFESNLPVRLYELVIHHIRLIKQALAEYPISGAKALREVKRTAQGEIIEIKKTVDLNTDLPEIKKLDNLWRKFNDATNVAYNIDRAIQLAHKASETIGGFLG
jgi:hypothetical protein